jgi:FkbM family methyltransferase
MLIPNEKIHEILAAYHIKPRGVLHIGAHTCEELPFYHEFQLSDNDIVWIDALPHLVEAAKKRGIPNVYHAVITDKDDEDITFNVSNNFASSSVLEFGTHSQAHPDIVYINTLRQKSITINSFIPKHNIDIMNCNFWNFDIQGAELLALKGATDWLPYADALYLEVNEKELYKKCGLIGDIDAFLKPYHFKRVITDITPYGWGDALYVRVSE